MVSMARAERPAAGVWARRFLRPEALTGYFLISPAVFLMLVLLAYPFFPGSPRTRSVRLMYTARTKG